ncbi:hypothetical protein IMAU70010_00191 [Lactiplantibacillus plantarum]|uniref:hypothetical protein n=1 Tax=Lactiplantibacillus plantarum TaxID=1590 RepID=UPI003838394A|nr:hypothetical protein [Lactiplantibacillus plantarum]MCG0697983.1 hypothetical protein [Lactiplantibacillus plantarum]MCG0700858.1 hypothetical protein [Lactiplantibacillus plantarum]MCG0725115.1 hypothetical protein [Lactiplantibacillus plantarum]
MIVPVLGLHQLATPGTEQQLIHSILKEMSSQLMQTQLQTLRLGLMHTISVIAV